jgi:thiol-disulfide isomerase/thioredoxin
MIGSRCHRIRAVGAAIVALALLTPALRAQESGIPVGSTAPAAALETLDGAAADLNALIGTRPLVIQFWATWCSNCRELEPTMVAAHARFKDRVTFVGVAVSVNQSPERVRRYIAEHMQGFTHFYDRRGNAVEAYDVPATSYVVILDAKGTVIYTGLGGRQAIEPAIERAVR